jgi:Uma2 family endonuclease
VATLPTTGLTYADLERFPEDQLRREIIDGELFVTAAPAIRHQIVVAFLTAELVMYQRTHGGIALPAPTDVFFNETNVVEPDVIFVRADHIDRAETRFVRSAPDLVVEVSSPSTRHTDLIRKRDLFERFGVLEYWFVDLDSDAVLVHRLVDGRYGEAIAFATGTRLDSTALDGFSLSLDDLFAA